ncbi:hypothetical protein [Sinorhizobium sp. M4_45]|uniref:hypothetical protein n=1 Tax=Sinorhizobium sp. M4_45 TaxID=2037901 RepID=UPI0015E08BD9|nr:hypothetical protein [Sinorhizobium sp. M4_45]
MNILARKTHVGGGRWAFPCRTPKFSVFRPRHLATLLRRVVFVGEPPFGDGLDFQRVGWGAMRSAISA